jgi:hypothetical protein
LLRHVVEAPDKARGKREPGEVSGVRALSLLDLGLCCENMLGHLNDTVLKVLI